MPGALFLIMLQVTGHAGGVPKAILERGRSVEFPSEGNFLFQYKPVSTSYTRNHKNKYVHTKYDYRADYWL